MASTRYYEIALCGHAIETTVTSKGAAVQEWLDTDFSRHANSITFRTGGRIIIGLDCERKPNASYSDNNETAILQLCVDTKCLIVQLLHLDYIPRSLGFLLTSSRRYFVGVEVGDDVLKLEREYGLACAYAVDVQALAMERWPTHYLGKPGLKTLAHEVAGIHIDKPEHMCLSDWEARVLSYEQIKYACIDAFASYKIGKRLLDQP